MYIYIYCIRNEVILNLHHTYLEDARRFMEGHFIIGLCTYIVPVRYRHVNKNYEDFRNKK